MNRRGFLARLPQMAAAAVAAAQLLQRSVADRRWVAVESWAGEIGQRMYAQGFRVVDVHYDQHLRYAVSYLVQR